MAVVRSHPNILYYADSKRHLCSCGAGGGERMEGRKKKEGRQYITKRDTERKRCSIPKFSLGSIKFSLTIKLLVFLD